MKLSRALPFFILATLALGDSESSRLARKGRLALRAGDLTDAFLLYTQAARLDPGNKSYRAKLAVIAAKAAPLAKPSGDKIVVTNLDSKPTPDLDAVFDAADDLRLQPAAALSPNHGSFDIDISGDFKTVYEGVAKLFRLDCVFDSDYEPGRRFRFALTRANYRDAMNALSAATNSFVVPVSDKVFIVAKDTPQKRTDLEQAMSVAVPIPQYVSTQELVELAQAVRQATGVEKMSWDNKTGSIVMRDRVSRVKPAVELFQSLFGFRPEVMIDLRLIELTRSDIVNYGINLPNSFNIAFTGQSTSTSSSTTGTLPANTPNPFPFNSLSYIFTVLASQTGSAVTQAVVRGLFPTSLSLFSIGIGEANALVNFSDSRGKTILTQNLRSVDAQPATFHYGERYPILTGSYSAGAGTTVGTQSFPTSSFTFEDLGVTLKVTPHIHGMESVTLDVESEFKLLSGSSVNGNPIISNRKLKSTVGLGNGEWAIVAGLRQNTDSRNVSGTAGLSRVPILGTIFSQHMKDKERSEVLIMMRPHLLSLPANQRITKEIWVGTESHPYTPLE